MMMPRAGQINFMYTGRVEIYQAERRLRKSSTPECFICAEKMLYENPIASGFYHRGSFAQICGSCRRRYYNSTKQAAAFGDRYRFIEKSEVPSRRDLKIGFRATDVSLINKHRIFTQLFHMLLLVKERRIQRRKEVNLMIEDMTREILKLPDRIARILTKTFAVAGDSAELEDDQALMQIRDLIEAIDPDILTRRQKKKKPSKA